MSERFYGRTARLFVVKGDETVPGSAPVAAAPVEPATPDSSRPVPFGHA